MKSALYVGRVTHRRFRPREHRLSYGVFWLLLDIDHFPTGLRWLSRNRFNLFSFYDRDYADQSDTALRPQIEALLVPAGIDLTGGTIRLLTMPRVLGYGFNPISVYFCQRPDESLAAIVYEVHNTFGERHSYAVAVPPEATLPLRHSSEKAFYVSPFLPMGLRYSFRIIPPGERAMLAITVEDSQGVLLTAALVGERKPMSDGWLARLFVVMPLLTLKVTGGIHWEALLLWLKKVALVPRPAPPTPPITLISSSPHGTPHDQR